MHGIAKFPVHTKNKEIGQIQFSRGQSDDIHNENFHHKCMNLLF